MASETEHSFAPIAITELTSRFRLRRGRVAREVDPVTQKPESLPQHFVSHRLDLITDAATKNADLEARAEGRAFVYRENSRDKDSAVLRREVQAVPSRGVFGYPTRRALKHWGEALSFFLKQGKWYLVTYPNTTAHPPAKLSLPPKG